MLLGLSLSLTVTQRQTARGGTPGGLVFPASFPLWALAGLMFCVTEFPGEAARG